jgi:spermidine/putrescine transport system ATP-binding protein
MLSPEFEPASMASPDAPVLSLQGVTKRFRDVVAVDQVTFEVRRGEFFSILGPSGCGKTTTLRMLAGFEWPTEGRILIEGKDSVSLPPYRRNTNMVFQNYALFPHMTVFENVAFGPQRKGLPRKEIQGRVGRVLDAVRLGQLTHRYPRELSGGQQQRVALARALANGPAVLLLDEPLGALDRKLREDMQFELKRIQREVGISFVYVTHDQGEALTMSDRIAVMNRGRVEHLGTPEEIYRWPATMFTASFIGQASLLPCAIEGVRSDAVTVRLAGGIEAIAGRAADGCSATTEAVLVLRPENLHLSVQSRSSGHSEVPVRVMEEVFQGAAVRYQLDGPGGALLWVVAPLEARLPVGSVGQLAWVSWDPEWAYVLPRPPSQAEGAGSAKDEADGGRA